MSTLTGYAGFHDVRFPLEVALGARGGPERRTDIVTLASGREERNARWSQSRRRYNAGSGVRSLAVLSQIIAFFEERRGRLHGFRYRDPLDCRSCAIDAVISPLDQALGTGDGASTAFQLVKAYGSGMDAYLRTITKPDAASVRVAVAGIEQVSGTAFVVDEATGMLTFLPGHAPGAGQTVSAGFVFDVPVRFDTDSLDINLSTFRAGELPDIPLIELIL